MWIHLLKGFFSNFEFSSNGRKNLNGKRRRKHFSQLTDNSAQYNEPEPTTFALHAFDSFKKVSAVSVYRYIFLKT